MIPKENLLKIDQRMTTKSIITVPKEEGSKYNLESDLILSIRYSKLESNFDIAKTLLLVYGNINKIDKNGETLLIKVLQMNDKYMSNDIIKLIIDKGSHLNKIHNPFMKMVTEFKDLVDTELSYDIIKNMTSSLVPLILAAKKNNVEIIKYLLLKGANIDEQDKNGDTLLITSVLGRQTEIFKLAIEFKANVNLLDKFVKSALYYAFTNNHIDDIEYIKILLNEGAEMYSANSPFEKAISQDIFNDTTLRTQLFFEKGAKIKNLRNCGLDRLTNAIKINHFDMCYLLINNGVDVKGTNNVSPLMSAFTESRNDDFLQLIKFIIEKGGKFDREEALKNIDSSNTKLILFLKENTELLLKAIKSKNLNMIKLLSKEGICFDAFIEIIRLNNMDLLKYCFDNNKLVFKRDDVLKKLVDDTIELDILNFIYEKF